MAYTASKTRPQTELVLRQRHGRIRGCVNCRVWLKEVRILLNDVYYTGCEDAWHIKEGTILVKLNQTTEYLEREPKEESIESTTVQRL